MVFDAEVADAVDAFARLGARADALHDDGRGLLPALVATRSLPRLERRDEPVREGPDRLLERARHLVDHGATRQDVPLHGEACAHTVTGPVQALRAGERRGASLGGDETEL